MLQEKLIKLLEKEIQETKKMGLCSDLDESYRGWKKHKK